MNKLLTKILTKIKILIIDLIPTKRSKKDSKDILIVFGGVIGDSVLFLDSIRGYKELFPKNDGYSITVYAPENAAIILKNYTEDINIIGVDFKKLNTDFSYHKSVISELKKKDYYIAVNSFPVHSNESDSIMRKCKAQKKYQLVEKNHSLKISERFINCFCGKKIFIESGLMELQKYAEVVRKLGLKDFKCRIPSMENVKNVEIDNNVVDYCVFAVGASTPCKRWEAMRFAELANYITDNNKLNIIVCGGKGEEFIFEEMIPYLNDQSLVYSYIGKTSLNELVSLIKCSKFLIGNDSSSVHIAAAVKTPAICIVGGWDYGRMYPYQVDEVLENDVLPIKIDEYMPCYGCAVNGIGSKNLECQKRIKHNKTYPCIDKIDLQTILPHIDRLLKNN